MFFSDEFAFYGCYKLKFITFTLIADLLCVFGLFMFGFILLLLFLYKKRMGIFRLRGGLTP